MFPSLPLRSSRSSRVSLPPGHKRGSWGGERLTRAPPGILFFFFVHRLSDRFVATPPPDAVQTQSNGLLWDSFLFWRWCSSSSLLRCRPSVLPASDLEIKRSVNPGFSPLPPFETHPSSWRQVRPFRCRIPKESGSTSGSSFE